jgi:hypothetical protein
VRNIGAILFLFVPCFHFVTLTFVIAMASASQYDSRQVIWRKRVQCFFFHIDSLLLN